MHSFGPSLALLAAAIRTDIEWIRRHTQLGEAAQKWDVNTRLDAFLIRGEELVSARDWLSNQPKYSPEPSILMREFLKASDDAELARENKERGQLETMRRVQLEREKALEVAEEANRKRATFEL